MRKGTVVFLVLMVCSALIIGTTLGIISVRHYLIPHLAAASSSPQITDNPAGSQQEEVPSPPVSGASDNRKPENTAQPSPSRHREPESSSSMYVNDEFTPAKLLLLTENEIKEIKSMLRELGYETSNLSEAVKQFQEKNHLTATGYLDTETLTSIMTQVLRHKVTKLTP